MTLHTLVESYVALHQALGKQFHSNARVLRRFARRVGPGTSVDTVSVEQVNAFLTNGAPLTRTYHVKYSILRGFFRYARSRGHVDAIPLPAVLPKQPPLLQPYVYSHEEMRRLVGAIDALKRRRDCCMEPPTMHALLLLLYGAGLRISEAVALDRQDVDHERSLLSVHASKCFKSRLLPLGATLNRALEDHSKRAPGRSTEPQAPLFTTRGRDRVRQSSVRQYFRLLCERAGVRQKEGRRRPRLHDLRHTFAVHRLTSWYRQGADVQALLPHLCTYLGHGSLVATQVYLSMTPELLQQANNRFESYAFAEGSP